MTPLSTGLAEAFAAVAMIIMAFSLLHAALRLRKPGRGAGLFAVALTMTAAAAFCAGTLNTSLAGITAPRVLAASIAVGGALVLAGLILLRREQRFARIRPTESFGLLHIGVGIFAIVSALILPTLPQQFALRPAMAVTASPTASRTMAPTRTPRYSPTPTTAPSRTPTPTGVPTLTPTPTPSQRLTQSEASPSPANTDTLAPPPAPPSALTATATLCVIRPRANVNFRDGPSLDATRIALIPRGAAIQGVGRAPDSRWWLVNFEGQRGWVSADVVEAEPACAELPVMADR
jgi:hypothetical protein